MILFLGNAGQINFDDSHRYRIGQLTEDLFRMMNFEIAHLLQQFSCGKNQIKEKKRNDG